MKQLKVNTKCNGCGLCVVNSKYFEENDEGDARAVRGMSIQSEDLEGIKKVQSECPTGAIQIIDSGVTEKTGKEGVKDIIADLRKKCSDISVRKVGSDEIRLDIKKYPISVPSSGKEYRRDYSSEGAAKSAAKDELNRLCYSQNAHRPMLKKIFVEYKVDKLKPFYTVEDTPDSFYYEYNELVREYLADAYAEVCDLIGEDKIPISWKEFSFYPKDKESYVSFLKTFDDESTSSGIMAALKDLSYSDLDYYASDFEFEYDEEYLGTGLFGAQKTKKKWYFTGFRSCAKNFIDDLIWAIDLQSYDIMERASSYIEGAGEEFERELKERFEKKIQEMEKLTN
jgi:ferredoxin